MRPVPKTIALGGVPTGSMKAQLALIAAGTIKRPGSIPATIAAGARSGISKTVVAVLLVVSVRKVTASAMAAMMTRGCRPERTASCWATNFDSPDSTKACAMVIPAGTGALHGCHYGQSPSQRSSVSQDTINPLPCSARKGKTLSLSRLTPVIGVLVV